MNNPASKSFVFEFQFPLSAEAFGKWLERNNATASVMCMLGTYHVTINLHQVASHSENSGVSVTRTSDIEVTAHHKEFEMAARLAMQACQENV